MPDATRERLIIFTRYPESGKTKTRLIPVLGEEGAANLQRLMTERTVAEAKKLVKSGSVSLEIRYEGGEREQMAQWLGPDLVNRAQGPGDLGVRMAGAFDQGFNEAHRRVVVIGTDVPELDRGRMGQAFQALETSDLVLGPAADGGYYLIGLRSTAWQRQASALFEGIGWGTGEVLKATVDRATHLGFRFSLLEELVDVDRPEDLHAWNRISR